MGWVASRGSSGIIGLLSGGSSFGPLVRVQPQSRCRGGEPCVSRPYLSVPGQGRRSQQVTVDGADPSTHQGAAFDRV